jgi:hypothetical protein
MQLPVTFRAPPQFDGLASMSVLTPQTDTLQKIVVNRLLLRKLEK